MGSPLTEDFSDNMNNIQSVQSDFMPSNADPIFDNLDTVTPQSSWAENAFETVSDTVAIDGIDSNVVSDVASVAYTINDENRYTSSDEIFFHATNIFYNYLRQIFFRYKICMKPNIFMSKYFSQTNLFICAAGGVGSPCTW